eukprot:6119971-Alexandrium_andersonii.AAC.1
MRKGGRQGASETPFLWNLQLDVTFADLRELWADTKCGIDLQDGQPPVAMLIWADDIFTFSEGTEMLTAMLRSMSAALTRQKLRWKPESLQVIQAAALSTFPLEPVVCTGAGMRFEWTPVSTMDCLGATFDARASAETSVSGRLAAAHAHQADRRMQLRCRR